MCRSIMLFAVLVALVAFSGAVAATSYGAEFVADAVRTLPQQGQSKPAKMYVGKQGVRRVEYTAGSKKVVEIILPERGITWRLDPEAHTYVEIRKPATPPPGEVLANPCTGQGNLTCKSLGREQVHGREAEKWEIVASFKNQDIKMLRWVDTGNGFPLIQQMPNGQKAEMRLAGREQVNGRQVEKWELVSSWNKRRASSYQWYDPVLKLAVREEGPGGMVNELRNIQAGPQPEHLFRLPEGYNKTDLPEQGGLKLVPVR
jgi:hypothetical protein